MNEHFKEITRLITGASEIFELEVIQNLWSGYGQIARYGLTDSDRPSVVVKHVRLPEGSAHPRGWNTDRSHERKVKSYQVETTWYDRFSMRCDDSCRVPRCLTEEKLGDEVLMVLEDLDAAGFPERRGRVAQHELRACLSWLAHFHATFMSERPEGLWETGTYWHLATRPDELEVLTDLPLKNAAAAIDAKLNTSPFQTLVHGDAKLANFCFSADGQRVAAVDFQYVGGGCGMKDVAYFLGSCLNDEACEQHETELLDFYFAKLKSALLLKKPAIDADAVEQSWRELYPVAWTDFHRFLKGWSPGHWKINSYSERLAREVVAAL